MRYPSILSVSGNPRCIARTKGLLCIPRGAPDVVLDLCSTIDMEGEVTQLTDEARKKDY